MFRGMIRHIKHYYYYCRNNKPVLVNEFAKRFGIGVPAPIGYVGLGLTMDCNCRCKMCDIWEIYKKEPEKKKLELTASEWIELFCSSNLIQSLPQEVGLHITGGEPFLRKDIVDIIPEICNHTPFKETVVYTNGLLPDRIGDSLEKILSKLSPQKFLSVQVSIDGIEEVHNNIRGVPSGFSRSVESVKILQNLQKYYPTLRRIETGLVIQPENVDTLDNVLAFRRELGVTGGFMLMMDLPYFNRLHPDRNLSGYTEMQQTKLVEFGKRVRYPGMEKWVRNPGKRPLKCYAGYSSIYLDPYGDVYPCVVTSSMKDFVMGNTRRDRLDVIWSSKQAREVRKRVKKCEFATCWEGAEIRQTLIQHNLFYETLKVLSLGHLDYYKIRGIR